MPVPQFLTDLLSLLFTLASPAAALTLVAAGLSLRSEGGINFHIHGKTGKWIVWTVILLTVPQILQWLGAQGVNVPANAGGISEGWMNTIATAFQNFVKVIVTDFIPVAAAFMVLKATLDTASGDSPLPSIVAAIFLLTVPATQTLLESWNSGAQTATTDMLASLWNYIAGKIMPSAAALAIVGAVVSFVQRRPVMRYVFAAIGFLTLTGCYQLIRQMVA
jgi:hypothetical protein